MASLLATTSTPSSFQLRWRLLCKKSPPALYSIRFRAPSGPRRTGLVRADPGKAAPGDAGAGCESRLDPDTSTADTSAGWSEEDHEGESSQGGGRFGGITGAVLAGVFLAGGVAFALLSLNGRRQPGFKPQMQPLSVQQEILLSSDKENDRMLVEEKSSEGTLEDNGPSSKSGINEDYNSSFESIEPTSPGRPNDNPLEASSLGPKPELVGVVVEASHHSDATVNKDTDTSSLISDPNSITNELSVAEAYNDYSPKDTQSQMISEIVDSAVQFSENEDVGDPVKSTASERGVLDIDGQDNDFISDKSDKSDVFADPNSQSSSKPLDSGIPLTIEPNLSVGAQDDHENLEKLEVDLNEQDIKLGEKFQTLIDDGTISPLEDNTSKNVPSGTTSASALDENEGLLEDSLQKNLLEETVNSTSEGNPLNGNGFSEASSLSVFDDHYINESGFDQHDQVNRSITTSVSQLPKTSFSHAGIPAPSVVSPALQVQPGKVLIPAVVDQVQGQALAALQVLKVIEADVQPGDICTRREYTRWLVSASSALSRSTASKVYPAMYIENVTELAFDDITPEDPDFLYIQGLAEAGLISSKLSRFDNMDPSLEEQHAPIYFFPESPLSRQDLVSWKMVLEKRELPKVDRKTFHERAGYLDADKINPDAWPAIVADISSGENGIISLSFGYTRLFQPEKPVTKAQAAVALSTGDAAEVVGEELARIEAESLAESAVQAHTELVAEVEKDLNAIFERELAMEREKIDAMEKLAQEARLELEQLRSEREEENNALFKERAVVEAEMEILSRLRNDVEEQLQNLLSNKTEIAFEHDRVNKLREEAEKENLAISQLQYELEVERKALAMARAWAEDEAKRAREQARALEEARERWQKHGIKVIVDEELRDSASAGETWQTAVKQVTMEDTGTETKTLAEKMKSRSQHLLEELKVRGEQLMAKLNALLDKVMGKSAAVIEGLIQKIRAVVSSLKQRACGAKIHVAETIHHVSDHVTGVKDNLVSKARMSIQEFKDNASELGSSVRDNTRKATEEFRESVDKITQRFKI